MLVRYIGMLEIDNLGNLVGESVRFIGGGTPLLQNSLSTLQWYGRMSETVHNDLKEMIATTCI